MMTHEEYVDWDASRIFDAMRRKATVYTPEFFVLNNDWDLPRLPRRSGVYILFTESGGCEYVGESCDVRRRVTQGYRQELDCGKYMAFIPVFPADRKAAEKYWMGLLKPRKNKEIWQRCWR